MHDDHEAGMRVRPSPARIGIAVCAGVAATAYLGSLGLSWLVAGSDRLGLLAILDQASTAGSARYVSYLLLTLVALGMTGAAAFSGAPVRRWYALAAILAALADLGVVLINGYRIFRIEQAQFGIGWYAAAVTAVACCLATTLAARGTGLSRGTRSDGDGHRWNWMWPYRGRRVGSAP